MTVRGGNAEAARLLERSGSAVVRGLGHHWGVTLFALLALLPIVFLIAPMLAVAGIWEAATGRSMWPRLASEVHARLSGIVKLVVVGTILWIPLLAVPIAESHNGWVDEDGDRMLDGFDQGGYDWLDINAPTIIGIWGTSATFLILGVLLTGWRLDRASEARDEPARPVDGR